MAPTRDLVLTSWLLSAAAFGGVLVAGCSSSSSGAGSTTTAVAPGPQVCSVDEQAQEQDCTCTGAASAAGSCSPESLGTPAHCCAGVLDGVTASCECQQDEGCMQFGSDCGCGAEAIQFLGFGNQGSETPSSACRAPSGGHCCRGAAGRSSCICSATACASDETELDGCAAEDGTLSCTSVQMMVGACQ